jgi:activated CDC42 kinase 1
VEEVFRELDSIKPELNNDITDNELAINETTVNVKNEVREINLRINKEALHTSSKGKKQAMVKPISASDQMELDSAIAMAKDIATRSMLTLDSNDHHLRLESNSILIICCFCVNVWIR